ncbi:olfactory receptor 13A1-like [Phyllobates terribilis]|uniref:olfactory receptor 13A1-like n=1 Tax=Phyllobates terribilis TaxID=111132 RepID=UPI003CCA819A
MQENNWTLVNEFFLLGFKANHNMRLFLFSLLLIVYNASICGNLLIIALVSTSKNLHTPMYFFISQLSITDILLISDIVPNIFYIVLNNGVFITFFKCMAQLYFFCIAEACECLLLAVMSYDRYVAICKPLHYISIMTGTLCWKLAVIIWFISFSFTFIHVKVILRLKFCGPNIIDHLFCDLVPLQDISCSDTFPIKLSIYFLSIPLMIIPGIIIVISYGNVVRAILQISSNVSRQKVFSTCSSHLTVVSIFYFVIFIVYFVPTKRQSSDVNKILSLLYTVFTPLVNPIIYSFRNKDIRKAVQETFQSV